MRRSILLVAKNCPARDGIVEALTDENEFNVCVAATTTRAEAWMDRYGDGFDLIAIEIEASGAGLALCASLRRLGAAVPIVILSACGQEDDVLLGFEAGADDFLVLPMGMREVAARIRAQLRRSAPKMQTPAYLLPQRSLDRPRVGRPELRLV